MMGADLTQTGAGERAHDEPPPAGATATCAIVTTRQIVRVPPPRVPETTSAVPLPHRMPLRSRFFSFSFFFSLQFSTPVL